MTNVCDKLKSVITACAAMPPTWNGECDDFGDGNVEVFGGPKPNEDPGPQLVWAQHVEEEHYSAERLPLREENVDRFDLRSMRPDETPVVIETVGALDVFTLTSAGELRPVRSLEI